MLALPSAACLAPECPYSKSPTNLSASFVSLTCDTFEPQGILSIPTSCYCKNCLKDRNRKSRYMGLDIKRMTFESSPSKLDFLKRSPLLSPVAKKSLKNCAKDSIFFRRADLKVKVPPGTNHHVLQCSWRLSTYAYKSYFSSPRTPYLRSTNQSNIDRYRSQRLLEAIYEVKDRGDIINRITDGFAVHRDNRMRVDYSPYCRSASDSTQQMNEFRFE